MIEHIAFIMDGNGRWAEKRSMPRKFGHKMGTMALERTIDNCAELGVKFVTFYAFSTENWSRPQEEVDYLFDTFRSFLKKTEKYLKKGCRIRFIGNLDALPKDIADGCRRVMQDTAEKEKITVVIALNYGSWEEVISAVNSLLAKGVTSVTKEDLIRELYTVDIPFPDLVVRTGGEVRLSNFLLLQSAYSELIFTNVLWPSFNKRHLLRAIEEYNGRTRRFGGLGHA